MYLKSGKATPFRRSLPVWVIGSTPGVSAWIVFLHKTIRNIDFSATQHYSIVATLLRMVTTLFQHCNAVLL